MSVFCLVRGPDEDQEIWGNNLLDYGEAAPENTDNSIPAELAVFLNATESRFDW